MPLIGLTKPQLGMPLELSVVAAVGRKLVLTQPTGASARSLRSLKVAQVLRCSGAQLLRRLRCSGTSGQQACRQASRLRFLNRVEKPELSETGHIWLGVPWYSMCRTALPALMKGLRVAHSLYWLHCSLTAKS